MIAACQVPADVLASVRSSLSFGCGVPLLDDGIALGYLMVNTGKLQEALALFRLLLEHKPDLVAARWV
jgi:hypothetical protein